MKKMIFRMMAVVAVLSVGVACNKETAIDNGPEKQEQVTPESGKKMTITAKLSDALTKVSFDPVFEDGNLNNKPEAMAHTWEAGDQLRITNAKNQVVIYDLTEGAGTNLGTFEGDLIEDGPFTVEVIPVGEEFDTDYEQTQLKDGDTSHLRFVAFELSETSQIIAIIAKLPADVAVTVNSLEIVTSVDDFATKTTLKVNLTNPEDVDTDDFLKVYANAPATWSIPVGGAKMLLRFNSVNANHTVYTRYQEFTEAVTADEGKFNYIRMDCSHIDQYAGKADNGTSAHPYLIADKYQLKAMHDLMEAGATKCFKLVDNIDMTGETWSGLNPDDPYNQLVDFDGNNKTISYLAKNFFYVFKGSARDLTLDHSSVTARGIFTEYIQGTGHEITNVTVSNGTVSSSAANVGGMIGVINNGTAGVNSVTITDCSVLGTNVTGGSVVGGLVGFANALITMSGCTYSGGTVRTAGRYLGGAIGSTANEVSVISDCHVEDATVTSTNTNDARCGGFIGQSQTKVQIKGCTVGTDTKKVVINTAKPSASDIVLNAGGFVGVNYGTITKNGSVRNKAYVQVKSSNDQGQPINIGGFVGFHRGTIEYCDADVDMSSLQGQYIGGFSGYMMNADSKADQCTLKGSVKGNNYTGGFVGVVDNTGGITDCHVLEGTVVNGQSTTGGFAAQIKAGTVENCSVNADVQSRGGNTGGFVGALTGGTVQGCSSAGILSQTSSTNTVFGGFAGYVKGADLTKCSSTVNITVARNYVGGLIGELQTANTISECFYNGTISGPTNFKGGLIGRVLAVAAVITDCYTSGEIIASSGTQIYGGIVGELLAGASVINCYSTMDISHGGRATGGIVGRACSGGWPVSNASGNTISKCIAWNPNITFDGTPNTSASSGAIIGYTSFKNILNNCYRRYDMVYKNSNTAVGTTCQTSMVDQEDCDGTNWAINGNRPAGGTPAGTSADAQYQAPYYGVAAATTATVSSVAQSLGWSTDIWDFTGDLPTLK